MLFCSKMATVYRNWGWGSNPRPLTDNSEGRIQWHPIDLHRECPQAGISAFISRPFRVPIGLYLLQRKETDCHGSHCGAKRTLTVAYGKSSSSFFFGLEEFLRTGYRVKIKDVIYHLRGSTQQECTKYAWIWSLFFQHFGSVIYMEG